MIFPITDDTLKHETAAGKMKKIPHFYRFCYRHNIQESYSRAAGNNLMGHGRVFNPYVVTIYVQQL